MKKEETNVPPRRGQSNAELEELKEAGIISKRFSSRISGGSQGDTSNAEPKMQARELYAKDKSLNNESGTIPT